MEQVQTICKVVASANADIEMAGACGQVLAEEGKENLLSAVRLYIIPTY